MLASERGVTGMILSSGRDYVKRTSGMGMGLLRACHTSDSFNSAEAALISWVAVKVSQIILSARDSVEMSA